MSVPARQATVSRHITGERLIVSGFQNSKVSGEKNDNQVRDLILSSSNYTENGSDVNSQFLLD